MEAISRLGLDIDTRQLVRGAADIDRLKQRTDAAAASATKLEQAQDSLNRQMGGMLATVGSLAAAVGGVFLLGQAIKYGDAWKTAANQIKTAITNVNDLKTAQQGVFDVAQRTYASYEATASLFARLGRGAGDQLKGQQDLLRIVETVNKALAVGGASKTEREGSIIQLGQALGSGLLQGDELRSLRENASVLFKSIQTYVKDTYNVSGAAFKKFAADGKITTDIVLESIRKSTTAVDAMFDKLDPTVGMGWQKLQNAIEKFVGEGGAGTFTAIALALGAIADNLETVVKLAEFAGAAFLALNARAIFTGGVKGLTMMVDVLGNMAARAVIASGATGGLSAAFGALAASIQLAAAEMLAFVMLNPLTALAAVILAAVAAIAVFSDKIVVATSKFEDLNDIGEKVTRDLSVTLADRFGAIWDVITSDMDQFGQGVLDFFGNLGTGIGVAIVGIGEFIAGLFGPDTLRLFQDFTADVGKLFGDLPGYAAIAVNHIYAFFAGLTTAAGKLFQTLPAVLVDVGVGMANALLGALETGINSAIEFINDFVAKVNAILHGVNAGFQIQFIDEVALGRLKNDSAGAGAEVGKAFSEAYALALKDGGLTATIGAIEQNKALARARAGDKNGNDLGGGANPKDLGVAIDPKSLDKAREAINKLVLAWQDGMEQVSQQAWDLEEMFLDLEKQANLANQSFDSTTVAQFDRQLDVLEKAKELLKDNVGAYAALGSGAQAAAEADAKRVLALKDAVGWARLLKQTVQDSDRLSQLSSALAISPDEYDTLKATFDLLDQFPDLTLSAARAEATKQVAISKTTQLLDRQAERARELAEAPAQNWLRGIEAASDDFWTNFVDKGAGAFDDLGDAFKQIWKQLQADILRNQFEPWLQKIKGGIGSVAGGGGTTINIGQGGGGQQSGGGSGSLFGGLFNLYGSGGTSAKTKASNPDGPSDPGFADTAGGLSDSIGVLVKAAVYANVGSALEKGLFGAKNEKNAEAGGGVGGVVGGIIGSFVYGQTYLGSAIGSFLGRWIGGALGPDGNSDHGAYAGLTKSGIVSVAPDAKKTAQTDQAVRTAADLIATSQKLLVGFGGTLKQQVDELLIGVRDPSRFSLTGDNTLIESGSTGDPNELADAAMKRVLAGTVFKSETLNSISKVMLDAGASFQEILKVLGQITDVMPDATKPLSEWGTALKALQDTFQGVRDQTEKMTVDWMAYGAANGDVKAAFDALKTRADAYDDKALQALATAGGGTEEGFYQWHYMTYGEGEGRSMPATDTSGGAAIDAAYETALGGLRTKFNQSITDAIDAVNAPLKAQVKSLFDSLTQRIGDATSIGGDMSKVLQLNAIDIKAFVEQAGDSAEAFAQLSSALTAMRAEAVAAGQDVAALDNALAETKTSLRNAMNKSISDAITQIESPLQAQIAALLKTQTDRIAAGAGLGADMSQIMRLNSDELKQFITNASGSADAFAKLNDVFEDLKAKAAAAGQDVAAMTMAFTAAKAGLASAFDDATKDAMLQIANPTLVALQAMLKTQQARLTQAQQLGANITAVERLNAMETATFFENLSSEQRNQLGDYLGLIQDFTGQIAVTLQKLGDEISGQIDALDNRRQALLDRAQNLRGFADGIDSTRQGLADKYSGLNPLASLEALRARFGGLADDANAGNESALAALPQVASQLVELSRSLYGSTTAFRADYETVDRALATVSGSTKTAASLAESQAQTILEQRDLLIEIRAALQSPDPALDFLQQQVGLLDDNNTLIAQLLQAYLNLEAAQAGQVLTDAGLSGAATGAVTSAGANPAGGGVQTSTPAATENSSGDSAMTALQAEQIDVMSTGLQALQEQMADNNRELRRIGAILLQQAA